MYHHPAFRYEVPAKVPIPTERLSWKGTFPIMIAHYTHSARPLVPAVRPPCQYDPQMWDLEAVNFVDARHAALLCETVCKQGAGCLAALEARLARGDSPKNQVIAGKSFSSTGVALDTDTAVRHHMERLARDRHAEAAAAGSVPQPVPDTGPTESPAAITIAVTSTGSNDAAQRKSREKREQTRRVLAALDSEVQTAAGPQLTLALGA